MGWLHATPKKADKPRIEIYANTVFVDVEPDFECAWLVDLAINCGLKQSNGISIIPISWSEIKSWADITGNTDSWVLLQIKKLSEAFVEEFHLSDEPNRLSPLHSVIDIQDRRQSVSKQIKSFAKAKSSIGVKKK